MSEKTEKPSAKKLRDARNRGEVVKSPMVIQTVSLGLLIIFFVFTAPAAIAWVGDMFQRIAIAIARPDSGELMWSTAGWIVSGMVTAIVAIFAVAALGAFIGAFMQVRALFSMEPLKPKFERLNPGQNVKNLFSVKQLVELVKSVLKLVLLGAGFYITIKADLPNMLRAQETDTGTLISMTARMLISLLIVAFLISLVLSVLDYAVQHYQFMKQQKMSKQDQKYEHKDQEGDPHIRGKRKQMHRQLIQAPLRQQVERASVVVTNPTHISVGIRYVQGEDPIPLVVTKGADDLAAEIRKLAESASIPIIRSPRLARALFAQTELDEYIAEEFFDAVAAVLTAASEESM